MNKYEPIKNDRTLAIPVTGKVSIILNALEVIPKDVIKNLLMHHGDELHNDMACLLVNEASHGRVFEVLKLVTQVNVLNHRVIINDHRLFKLDDIREEISITCSLTVL